MFTGIFHSFCYCKSVTRLLRTEAATRGVLSKKVFLETPLLQNTCGGLLQSVKELKSLSKFCKVNCIVSFCHVTFPASKKSNSNPFHVSVLQFYLNYSSQLVWMVTVLLFFFQSCYVLFLKLVTLKVDHGRFFIKKGVFSFFCYLGVNCLPWAGPKFFLVLINKNFKKCFITLIRKRVKCHLQTW